MTHDCSLGSERGRALALCTYKGRGCLHPREVKSNGELHSFCAAHRAKANTRQRASQLRKKQKTQHGAIDEGASFLRSIPLSAMELGPLSSAHASVGAREHECKYTNCAAPRVVKSTGALHRYCRAHQEMARQHQRSHLKKRQEATPIAPVVGTTDYVFSNVARAFPFAQSFRGTGVVSESTHDNLGGVFTVLMDNVPHSAAAHVWWNEVPRLDPRTTVSSPSDGSREEPLNDGAIGLDDLPNSSGGSDFDPSTMRDNTIEPLSVLLLDVPEESARVLFDLAELDDLGFFDEWPL